MKSPVWFRAAALLAAVATTLALLRGVSALADGPADPSVQLAQAGRPAWPR